MLFRSIASEFHDCQAIALEDMEVCRLAFDEIENLARWSDQFGHDLHKLLSQESARAHEDIRRPPLSVASPVPVRSKLIDQLR